MVLFETMLLLGFPQIALNIEDSHCLPLAPCVSAIVASLDDFLAKGTQGWSFTVSLELTLGFNLFLLSRSL